MINWLNVELYQPIFLTLIVILSLLASSKISQEDSYILIEGDPKQKIEAFILASMIVLFIGARPVDIHFGDMLVYNRMYEGALASGADYDFSEIEWAWYNLMIFCTKCYFESSVFFLIVCSLSVFSAYIGIVRLFKENAYYAMLFYVGTFCYYAYLTNGVRTGLAVGIMVLAISFMRKGFLNQMICAFVCFLAYNVHHSMLLPIIGLYASYYLIKSPQYAIVFWFFSIILSLLLGNTIDAFFVSLGFDDRLNYITLGNNEDTMKVFSHTGFRWDFLLYSFVPLYFGWDIIKKYSIQDRAYFLLFNTYVISNSFWIMVIRASYSNRIAYLSWFIYGLCLAYPLLKLKLGSNQSSLTAKVLLANVGFTLFMFLIGK